MTFNKQNRLISFDLRNYCYSILFGNIIIC